VLLSSFAVAGQPMGADRWLGGRATPREQLEQLEQLEQAAQVAHRTTLTGRRYEMDSQHHINNCVYLDWVDEALRSAVREQPNGLMVGSNSLCPREYRIEYVTPMRAGEEVIIATRWSTLGTHGVAARHDITTGDGTLVVRARSLYLQRLVPAPTA
jgi:acyl-CoA thioesterase FadM